MTEPQQGKIVKSAFKPAWWARNRHIQTIWPRYLQKRRLVQLTNQRIELEDGDFVDLSWAPKPHNCRGIAVLFHGLEGSARSHYANDMLAVMADNGWHAVMMHFRGCSNEENRLARAYHSGDTADAWQVVTQLKRNSHDLPIVAIGFSLGANMLLKLLGEKPQQNIIDAAVCISPPFQLGKCSDAVNQGFSRLYQHYLLASMQKKLVQKMSKMDFSHSLAVNVDDVMKLNSFREFDDAITSRLHGFSDADDYYLKCSAIAYTRHITTPTLVIHSLDDPFMSRDIVPQAGDLSPTVTIELSEQGGHVGFMQGLPWKPQIWLHQRVPAFLNQFA
ncbi:hydrolase [Neptunicella marina]|uniref:Hydrolase n=1 Tax=Neptunicella marina TaxID=2125989 RepID=A0A8J6ITD4_9ALTE|nr:hydrolase [Neptunicella marina]MBC3765944.1 hydrolase [Neptunicella marina]